MKDVIAQANEGPEYIFISFDIDVIDSAFIPGTGTPEPGGLTLRESFPLIRRLCAERNVAGFELVELNPLADHNYLSALNANRIVREALTGIARRKLGLTEPHFQRAWTNNRRSEREKRLFYAPLTRATDCLRVLGSAPYACVG